MPTTTEELIVARSYIGETETEDVFDERFDRHYEAVVGESLIFNDTDRRSEALARAVEESLRAQLSAMTLDQPSSASAEGNSYSNVQNMISMTKGLEQFQVTYGSKRVANVTRFVRSSGR